MSRFYASFYKGPSWIFLSAAIALSVASFHQFFTVEDTSQNNVNTTIVVALTGGTLDIQEEGFYDKLKVMVRDLESKHSKTLGLIRHISEWKTLCDDLKERSPRSQKNTVSLLTSPRTKGAQLDALVGCLKQGKGIQDVQLINASYLKL